MNAKFGLELLDANASTSSATEALRRESVDIYNRLHSIAEDALFVSSVAAAYPEYPLLPNLRCGAWYTDPAQAASEPVYFKSTDGHHGQWAFNLRRANLHLLPLIAAHGGVILVDSTRRGKRIPDALAKTIPLWCAVLNTAARRQESGLYTPPGSVSASEHAQMESRVPAFADALLASQYILPDLAKPLRPFWVTPATTVLPTLEGELPYYPVICVSASRSVPDGIDRRAGYVYVQGSGDDHELWSQGLTPELYWRHRATILASPRDELPGLIAGLLDQHPQTATGSVSAVRRVDGRLWLGSLAGRADVPPGTSILRLGASQTDSDSLTELALPAPHPGKKGQHHLLRTLLPRGTAFLGAQLALGRAVCVLCDDGKDLSVGLAVAALQLFFDDSGALAPSSGRIATKESVRMRLQWALESRPGANPSRTTLKRVHEFLMSPAPSSA